MIKLRKTRYVLVLALLPYILAANAGLLVGWQCLNGSHLWESVDSGNLPKLTSGVPEHNPHHAKSLPEGITQTAHCCACSGTTTVEQNLADHSTSWTGWYDPAPTSDHESLFTDDLPRVLSRLASSCYPSHHSLHSSLASLHTVILLI